LRRAAAALAYLGGAQALPLQRQRALVAFEARDGDLDGEPVFAEHDLIGRVEPRRVAAGEEERAVVILAGDVRDVDAAQPRAEPDDVIRRGEGRVVEQLEAVRGA
jgi:hypothetical protein